MTIINLFITIALAVFLGLGTVSYSQEKKKSPEKREPLLGMSKEQKADYYCPMHPEVTSNKPGKCPKCGMSLEKKKVSEPKKEKVVYYCPMHPEVTSDKPGKCPKCGMNMEKKKSTGSKEKAEMGMNMEMDAMCAKMCEVMKDPSMMKKMEDCMMMGMNDMDDMKDMKDMKETKKGEMERMDMGMMKSCCGKKR